MKSNLKLLYNPFTRVAGWQAFAVGLPIVCATVVLGWLTGVVAYGLEVKLVGEFSLAEAFAATGIGLACTVAVMYLMGLIFSKGVRFQDILGTVTLARAPYILAPPVGLVVGADYEENLMIAISELDPSLINWGDLILSSVLMLAITVWAVAMLWHAFRVSTNLKGAKAVWLFILSLILSEILMFILLPINH